MRKRKEAEELLAKETALEKGDDYERKKNLEYTAEECDDWEARMEVKAEGARNAFASWDEANLLKHERLTSQIKPDFEEYEKQKALKSESLYRDADSLDYVNAVDNRPTTQAVDRMHADLMKQYDSIF
jgi:pre-mRNA-splicing factor SYF2